MFSFFYLDFFEPELFYLFSVCGGYCGNRSSTVQSLSLQERLQYLCYTIMTTVSLIVFYFMIQEYVYCVLFDDTVVCNRTNVTQVCIRFIYIFLLKVYVNCMRHLFIIHLKKAYRTSPFHQNKQMP